MSNDKFGDNKFKVTYHMKPEDPIQQIKNEFAASREKFLLKSLEGKTTASGVERFLNAHIAAKKENLISDDEYISAFGFAAQADTSKLTNPMDIQLVRQSQLVARQEFNRLYLEKETNDLALKINKGLPITQMDQAGVFLSTVTHTIRKARKEGRELDAQQLSESLGIVPFYETVQAKNPDSPVTSAVLLNEVNGTEEVRKFFGNNFDPLFDNNNPKPRIKAPGTDM